MHRLMLLLGLGTSLLAVGGCEEPRPPLTRAARGGDLDAIRSLLDAGMGVNAPDSEEGWPPLFHAVVMQQADAVLLLLERGANPNYRADRLTPLEVAAAQDDPAMVQLLLAHGADINARGPDGSTAFSVAVSGGALTDADLPLLGGCHAATVRALLAKDPTLRLENTFAGRRARWIARVHGCREILAMIKAD